ncbi:tyrosine-type recombinase/integrase [Pseudonocardia zijingensis]|uniref:Site-specific recombinase XerD n=1 Tax=Pseudonocardia zijingensis TaxID=153376 RepID=A0ABN1N8W4_9PSEU
MAWAEKIPSSGRYRGRYRDSRGNVQTLNEGPFTHKAEAERRAAVAEDEARRRPGQRNAKLGRATWGGWVEAWWPQRAKKVEPGTLQRDLTRRRKHLDPRWESTRLDKITRDDVQEWVDELTDDAGLAPRSVIRTYHLFSASMKAAVVDGRIAYSPCIGIDLPTPEPTDERYLTPEEVEALIHFLPHERDRLIVWALVGTGLRWGELIGAHLHRVHLEQRRLDVHEVYDDRVGDIKPYPKSKRKRSVPLPPWLVDMLRQHIESLPTAGRCGSKHRGRGRCRSGLLFPGNRGAAIEYSFWRRGTWDRAVRLAGIGDCTIHDLRHTYASWLVQDGVSMEQLRDLLGHSTVIVTERYSHLKDTRWDGVRDILTARTAPLLPHRDLALIQTGTAPASVAAGQGPYPPPVAGEGFEPS